MDAFTEMDGLCSDGLCACSSLRCGRGKSFLRGALWRSSGSSGMTGIPTGSGK